MTANKLLKEAANANNEPDSGSLTGEEREWLCSWQAAEYLGISVGSLLNMVSTRAVPVYKLGRRNRYRREELRQLLLSNRIGA